MKQDNNTPALRFKGFEGKWKEKKLGEIGQIVTGSTPPTSLPEYYAKDGVLWVTPTDICENVTFDSARKLSSLGEQVCQVIPKDSILVTCIASIGKNTLLGERGGFNQQINGLTPDMSLYDPYFLLTESTLWSEQMKKSAPAGTMQIINRTEFSEIQTLIPSYNEQKLIGDFYSRLDRLVSLHRQKLEKLQSLKKAMLGQMFPPATR